MTNSSGGASENWSERMATVYGPIISEVMKGSKFGNADYMMTKSFQAGKITPDAVEALMKYHLALPGRDTYQDDKAKWHLRANSPFSKGIQEDIVAWSQRQLEVLKKSGYDVENQETMNAMMNEIGSNKSNTFIGRLLFEPNTRKQIQAGITARDSALPSAAENLMAKDPFVKLDALKAKFQDLFTILGSGPIMDNAIKAITAITGGLNALNQVMEKNPEATKIASYALGAAASLAILSGAVKLLGLSTGLGAMFGGGAAAAAASAGGPGGNKSVLLGAIGTIGKLFVALEIASLAAQEPHIKAWLGKHDKSGPFDPDKGHDVPGSNSDAMRKRFYEHSAPPSAWESIVGKALQDFSKRVLEKGNAAPMSLISFKGGSIKSMLSTTTQEAVGEGVPKGVAASRGKFQSTVDAAVQQGVLDGLLAASGSAQAIIGAWFRSAAGGALAGLSAGAGGGGSLISAASYQPGGGGGLPTNPAGIPQTARTVAPLVNGPPATNAAGIPQTARLPSPNPGIVPQFPSFGGGVPHPDALAQHFDTTTPHPRSFLGRLPYALWGNGSVTFGNAPPASPGHLANLWAGLWHGGGGGGGGGHLANLWAGLWHGGGGGGGGGHLANLWAGLWHGGGGGGGGGHLANLWAGLWSGGGSRPAGSAWGRLWPAAHLDPNFGAVERYRAAVARGAIPQTDVPGAGATGIGVNTMLSSLNAAQRAQLINRMQVLEGWRPGTTSYNQNNPGNLNYAPWEQAYGVMPGYRGIMRFPTYAQGRAAMEHLIFNRYGNRTIQGLFESYVGRGLDQFGNRGNPDRYARLAAMGIQPAAPSALPIGRQGNPFSPPPTARRDDHGPSIRALHNTVSTIAESVKKLHDAVHTDRNRPHEVHMDGKPVGRIVAPHVAREMTNKAWAPRQAPHHDSRMYPTAFDHNIGFS